MSFPPLPTLGKFGRASLVWRSRLAACGGGARFKRNRFPGATAFPTSVLVSAIACRAPVCRERRRRQRRSRLISASSIGTVNQYYLADKVTNGVDVVNSLSSQFLGTAGGGAFQGAGTTVAGFARSPNGGPNGVVSLGNGLVAAGDGNSTLKIVSSSYHFRYARRVNHRSEPVHRTKLAAEHLSRHRRCNYRRSDSRRGKLPRRRVGIRPDRQRDRRRQR